MCLNFCRENSILYEFQKLILLEFLEITIYIINPQVCLSVTPCISGTVRPRVMKLCMRNLHKVWKISTEKKIGKIEKKISKYFPDFSKKNFSPLFDPK